MSVEQNKSVVRKFFEEIMNKGNLNLIDELVASNWVNIDSALPPLEGQEGARKLVMIFRSAFPNMHAEIPDLIADGDRVAAVFSGSATQNGEFMGFPPSGKSVKLNGIGVFRLTDGRLAENRVNVDMLSVLQQIGAVPPPQR